MWSSPEGIPVSTTTGATPASRSRGSTEHAIKDMDRLRKRRRLTGRLQERTTAILAVSSPEQAGGRFRNRGSPTISLIRRWISTTNNIGEFLAIVHAMALMAKEGKYHNIYSDSVSGMAWARTRKVKTQLKPTPRNAKVFELMARAVTWLNTHQFPAKVMKWQTEKWGEIPADFGRK